MARIDPEVIEQVKILPQKELVKIVLKLMSKKENLDLVMVRFLDKENGSKDLFLEAKKDIDALGL